MSLVNHFSDQIETLKEEMTDALSEGIDNQQAKNSIENIVDLLGDAIANFVMSTRVVDLTSSTSVPSDMKTGDIFYGTRTVGAGTGARDMFTKTELGYSRLDASADESY